MSKLGNAGEFSRFKINPELDNYRLAWKLEIQLIKFKYQSLTRGIYIYTIQGYIYLYIYIHSQLLSMISMRNKNKGLNTYIQASLHASIFKLKLAFTIINDTL